MDPVSVVTALPDLISTAKATYDFVQKYYGSKANYTDFIRELDTTRSTLTAFNEYVLSLADGERTPDALLDRLKESVSACGKAMDEIEKNFRGLDGSGWRARWKRFKFAWKGDEDIRTLYTDLQKQNNKIFLILGIDNGSKITALQLAHEKARIETAKKEEEEKRIRAEDSKRRLLDWVNPVKTDEQHQQYRSGWQSGTCEWLPETQEFKTWVSTPGSFLWMNGIPGNGKSVLASSVIEHLRRTYAEPKTVTIFFYCNFRDARSLVPAVILQTLFAQLLIRLDSCIIADAFSELIQNVERKESPTIVLKEIVSLIYQACSVSGWERVYVVIDALDECSRNEREKLLKELSVLAASSPSRVISLFTTSRVERDITDIFSGTQGESQVIALSQKVADVGNDIESYLTAQFSQRRRLARHSADVKNTIKNELLAKADGMFRLVELQLMIIEQQPSVAAIEEALRDLPKGLFDTYRRVLPDPERDHIKALIVQRTLHFIVGALRKVSLAEISEMVMIEVDQDTLKKFSPKESTIHGDEQLATLNMDLAVLHPTDIIEYCSYLVTYDETRSETVSLSHTTVQEFLLAGDCALNSPGLSSYAITDVGALHFQLGVAMIAYLQLPHFETEYKDATCHHLENPPRGHPMLPYAAECWLFHMTANLIMDDYGSKSGGLELHATFPETMANHFGMWGRYPNSLLEELTVVSYKFYMAFTLEMEMSTKNYGLSRWRQLQGATTGLFDWLDPPPRDSTLQYKALKKWYDAYHWMLQVPKEHIQRWLDTPGSVYCVDQHYRNADNYLASKRGSGRTMEWHPRHFFQSFLSTEKTLTVEMVFDLDEIEDICWGLQRLLAKLVEMVEALNPIRVAEDFGYLISMKQSGETLPNDFAQLLDIIYRTCTYKSFSWKRVYVVVHATRRQGSDELLEQLFVLARNSPSGMISVLIVSHFL